MPAPTSTAVEGTNSPIMRSASPKAIRKTTTIAQSGLLGKIVKIRLDMVHIVGLALVVVLWLSGQMGAGRSPCLELFDYNKLNCKILWESPAAANKIR